MGALLAVLILAQGWTVEAANDLNTGISSSTVGLAAAAAATVWAATTKRTRPRRAKKKAMRESGVDLDGQQPSSLFFGNITAWGPQARRFFQAQIAGTFEGKWDAIGIAEHHLRGDRLRSLKATFKRLGYTAKATEGLASAKSDSGTTGGVAVAAPVSRTVTLRDATHVETDCAPKLHGEDWIISIMHRRGFSVAYVVAYFLCGGYGEGNRRRVRSLWKALAELKLPFIIAADWNATPEEVRDSGMLGDLAGKILVPNNATYTCSLGQERLLD